MRGLKVVKILVVGLMVTTVVSGRASFADGPAGAEGTGKEATVSQGRTVDDERLDESSGLAISRLQADRFWTHNDSGDQPRLFLVDKAHKQNKSSANALAAEGRELCPTVRLAGAEAVDWEDMASAEIDGKAYLFVGDIGDNLKRRETIDLYVLLEPEGVKLVDGVTAAVEAGRIRFRYADGPRDCEALVVDAARQQVLLIEKSRLPWAGVYLLRLPEQWQRLATVESPAATTEEPLVAERIGTVPIPMVTGADLRADGQQLAVITYFDLFLFERGEGESWQTVLGRTPRHVGLPKLKQVEAVAYDQQGRLWVSSERFPMALQPVSLAVDAGGENE